MNMEGVWYTDPNIRPEIGTHVYWLEDDGCDIQYHFGTVTKVTRTMCKINEVKKTREPAVNDFGTRGCNVTAIWDSDYINTNLQMKYIQSKLQWCIKYRGTQCPVHYMQYDNLTLFEETVMELRI